MNALVDAGPSKRGKQRMTATANDSVGKKQYKAAKDRKVKGWVPQPKTPLSS